MKPRPFIRTNSNSVMSAWTNDGLVTMQPQQQPQSSKPCTNPW